MKTKIYNLDFEKVLNKFELNENDFIFLDPPYDSEFSTYDQNSFDKNEQIRLADFLKNTKACWMLIIKKTDFIYVRNLHFAYTDMIERIISENGDIV